MAKKDLVPKWAKKIQPTLELKSPILPPPKWSHYPKFSIGLLDRQEIPKVLAAACHWCLPGYSDNQYTSPHNPSPQLRFGETRKYLHVHMWELHNHWIVPKGRRLRRNSSACQIYGCINPHHWHLKPEHAAEFIQVGPRFNSPIQYGPDPGPFAQQTSSTAPSVVHVDAAVPGPGSGPNSNSVIVQNDSMSIDDFIDEIDGMRDYDEILKHFTSRDLLTEGEVMKWFQQLPRELKERFQDG